MSKDKRTKVELLKEIQELGLVLAEQMKSNDINCEMLRLTREELIKAIDSFLAYNKLFLEQKEAEIKIKLEGELNLVKSELERTKKELASQIVANSDRLEELARCRTANAELNVELEAEFNTVCRIKKELKDLQSQVYCALRVVKCEGPHDPSTGKILSNKLDAIMEHLLPSSD